MQEASAERYGRLRLGNVADVMGGKLDPAEYLRRGRHAEWTEAKKGSSPAPRTLSPVPSVLCCHLHSRSVG